MVIIDAFVPAAPASRPRASAAPIADVPHALDAAMLGRARVVRQRLEQCPEAVNQRASEDLASQVVSAATGAVDAVNAELTSVARVGVVLASARPGLKRVAFVFTDRLAPARRSECFLTTKPHAGELVLTVERLGQISELSRADLRDPDAPAVLRAAAERFVLEAAERFVRDAA
jgi:hypothetical protein